MYCIAVKPTLTLLCCQSIPFSCAEWGARAKAYSTAVGALQPHAHLQLGGTSKLMTSEH